MIKDDWKHLMLLSQLAEPSDITRVLQCLIED